MQIKFHNHDSNMNLCIESDKHLVFVYGKNGMGKTTLSRSSDLDSKFVFNEDFIFSNIYNINDSGAAQTAITKENFSGLWIGEDIVKIRKKITDIVALEKINNDELNKIIEKVTTFFQTNGIPFNSVEKLDLLKKKDFMLDETKYDETKSSYKGQFKYSTDIKSDDEFKKQVKYLKQNGIYNMLISMIKEDTLLSEIILKVQTNKLIEINEIVKELEKDKQLLLEIESIYKEKCITNDIIQKIKEWYEIHLKRSECVFCGNKNIDTAMMQWKKVFENRNIQNKNKLIDCYNVIINNCDKIISCKDFESVDLEVINFISNIKAIIVKKIIEIDSNNYLQLEIKDTIEKREILKENTIMENLVNYTLNKWIDQLEFLHNSKYYLTDLKKALMSNSDKLMEENGDAIADSINQKFIDFGLDKNITISVDKRSIPHKFTYSIKNHDSINELSDGQKHKVALAIFMDYLEKLDLSDKVIVIDDPVVSLDISGYILFKQYLISKLIDKHFKDSTKLIILTHDISYLYIQVSNIFQNEAMKNDTAIFKINSESVHPIPLDYIKTDDITLFRNLLDKLSNLKELRILNGIFIKIFRIMIDLKLRFTGLSFADDINISLLPYDDNVINKLKEYNSYFCKIGRKTIVSDEEIKMGLEYMKDTSEILGFSDFISDDHLKKVNEIINNKNENGDVDDLYDIVESVQKFLKKSNNDEMKNYINHTRNSYSRNLIGLDLDDYYK